MAKEKKKIEETNEKEINTDDSNKEKKINVESDESSKKLNELETKLNEALDKNIRMQAEFVNYKTRTEQEKITMFKYEGESFIKQILEVVDDFERAIKMDDDDLTDEVSNFLKGFKMIYARLIGILESLEVKEVDVEGKEFDPNYAEAILTEHDESKPENVVLEVLKKGYMYKDKLIRPAMVKVNK